MADSTTLLLTELTTPADGDFIPIVDVSEPADADQNKKISRKNLAGWTFLTTQLTSTSWDGDARSSASKTLIDLSAVFGVPAGVKAILARVAARDSASSTNTNLYFSLSPNTGSGGALYCRPAGITNDIYAEAQAVVPCDSNGDIYFVLTASGTDTMDVWLEIWGYFI